jgi:hypothetical protein
MRVTVTLRFRIGDDALDVDEKRELEALGTEFADRPGLIEA